MDFIVMRTKGEKGGRRMRGKKHVTDQIGHIQASAHGTNNSFCIDNRAALMEARGKCWSTLKLGT